METLHSTASRALRAPRSCSQPARRDRRSGVYHPDLLYPQWRLAIEYRGDQHRTDPRAWGRDIRRREAFEQAGYFVLPVTKDDVLAEPEALLARVCRAIAQQQHLRASGTLA